VWAGSIYKILSNHPSRLTQLTGKIIVNHHSEFRSWDSSVSIVMGCGLDGRGLNPGRGMIFLLSTASRLALGPTQPPIQWLPGAISQEVKRPVREADHLPPSSAEVKNGGARPPLPHMSSWHNA
jgi:hypothetical protein